MTERRIIIKCDFADMMADLFNEAKVQLAEKDWDGKNIHPEYPKFYNCFDYQYNYDNNTFAIVVRSKPVQEKYKEATENFLASNDWKSDWKISNFVRSIMIGLMNSHKEIFENYTYRELQALHFSLSEWELVTKTDEPKKSKPKMTHKELVELIGHDFEYVE